MNRFLKFSYRLIVAGVVALALGLVSVLLVYWYVAPQLPSIEVLKDIRLQVPLRVLSRDGALVAEFGEKKRDPVRYEEVPALMIQAILAAEDDRFFEHPGVDYQGILRAVVQLIRTGEKRQGGSTITMQVARNFFLTREKTFLRKINEIFLALKIERELTKRDVLELYLNKIYLGNRAYGIGAAAQVYYGKPIEALTVAEMAMIAGLPKAPSRFNPIANLERALARRDYVLNRMYSLGFITEAVHQAALAEPDRATLHAAETELDAPYLAEMVRAAMFERYGAEAYTSGLRVYTTVGRRLQGAATDALRQALLAYDLRHGYRGPERHVDLRDPIDDEQRHAALADVPVVGGLEPALVVAVDAQSAQVVRANGVLIDIAWDGLKWARRYLDENRRGAPPQQAADIVAPGDVVRISPMQEGGWRLVQVPEVEGALVSLAPDDGAILAVVGGFDYFQSKFNRATQAYRQPGSNFKPFVYSSALEHGFTPASIINDAPVVFDDPGLESTWRPENYSGKFYGPTRLRTALTKSRNLVSIRLLRSVGIPGALEHVARFGFDTERLPRDLSLALGSAVVTPLELASGYAVFANGGYRVEPYFIDRIESAAGEVLYQAEPLRVCRDCAPPATEAQPVIETAVSDTEVRVTPLPAAGDAQATVTAAQAAPQRIASRVLNAQNVYLMTSMMRDVIRFGTGRRALQLGRRDLAGKTGTTNDQHDAWFSGFNANLVATAWVGFDKVQPLGNKETGARAALPMWMAFMGQALRGMPETTLEQPEGLVTVRIDPETGQLASADNPDAVFETFRVENVPKQRAAFPVPAAGPSAAGVESGSVSEQLF